MADPPWDIHMELPYGTMADEEMRRMNVRRHGQRECRPAGAQLRHPGLLGASSPGCWLRHALGASS